jgi:hypothetical protein
VIVAVVAVRVVKMASDAIIHVVAVRHRLVAAAGPVYMACRVPTAAMVRSAAGRVLARHLDHMLVDMIFVRVVEGQILFSRLNGWPMRSPADASPTPSRMPAHGLGPMWIATPSS